MRGNRLPGRGIEQSIKNDGNGGPFRGLGVAHAVILFRPRARTMRRRRCNVA
jgi:hypothetical protein